MKNELRGSTRIMWEQVRHWLPTLLLVSWILGAAAAWTQFALAPVGTLASADAGRLVAIHGSTVLTTSGYFQVSADPSALRGTPMRVIRTNSMWSQGGLQLCTARSMGDDNWCADIRDGYAGALSKTSFADRAWSQQAMIAIFFLAFFVTLLGWFPAVAAAYRGGARCGNGGKLTSAT